MREFKIMGKDASLSERAVQQAANYKRPTRKRGVKRDNYSRAVSKLDLRIHLPEVAAKARELAGDDLHRIEQVGLNDLIVHNNPNWKKNQ